MWLKMESLESRDGEIWILLKLSERLLLRNIPCQKSACWCKLSYKQSRDARSSFAHKTYQCTYDVIQDGAEKHEKRKLAKAQVCSQFKSRIENKYDALNRLSPSSVICFFFLFFSI